MTEDGLARGIELFNQAKFFAAHEVLEDVWRGAAADDKKFFQGLTQVAVAFHHHSTGNRVGMLSVLRRAIGNLERHPAQNHPLNIPELLLCLHAWCDAIEQDSLPPALPRM